MEEYKKQLKKLIIITVTMIIPAIILIIIGFIKML